MKFLLTLLLLSSMCLAGENKPATNRPLVNQEGKPFQLYDLKGKYVLLSFIFTRCPYPNMCPLTVKLTKELFEAWKKAKGLPDLAFLFVTLDPTVDTPSVLKQFAVDRNLDLTRFTLATGDPSVLSSMAAEFQVVAVPEKGTIAHNMINVLLDPGLMVVKSYTDNHWKAEDIIKELRANRSVANEARKK